MKKIITLFAIVGLLSLQSCTVTETTDNVDYDTIPEAFEIKNKNFGYNNVDGYILSYSFDDWIDGDLYNDESILIYRLEEVLSSGDPVWQLIPRTLYTSKGELDYDYNFSVVGFTIFAGGNYDLSLTPQYLNNQTFRVVIIPSNLSASVDKNNYSEVMSSLNLKESQVKKVEIK